MSEREEILKELIKMQRSPVKAHEALGEASRRIFYETKARDFYLADSNLDYVQHERMYEQHFSDGFSKGANWLCWKLTGKSLLEVME